MESSIENEWIGLRESVRGKLETRDYEEEPLAKRLATSGIGAGEAMQERYQLRDAWIPGVEIFPRQVHQQKGRGYFAELVRVHEGLLGRIGLNPSQWASALMHRGSAKGFHIHPPHVPDGVDAEIWFRELYIEFPDDFTRRPYDMEQWDVMFFLTGLCEMILVDDRKGMRRRIMRFMISGDSKPGNDNSAVVIPPGVSHALRCIGTEDLIMVYGTSTKFQPRWEGRIGSSIESDPLPTNWADYLAGPEI